MTTNPPDRRLTRRQMQIAILYTDTDLTLDEIAVELGLAVTTTRAHVTALYATLGVHSRPQLRHAMLAVELAPARGAR